MKILIIEDEPDLLYNLVKTLQDEKYMVESANTFQAGLDKIVSFDYSCIVLDINLPGGSGFEILEKLRELKKTECVLIISARNSINDKVAGLELGADDYLTKPFHVAEFRARVKAILRRKSFEGHNHLRAGNLEVFFDQRTVNIHQKEVQLNRKEYDILIYLLANQNKLITKQAIATHVWGDHIDEADNFDFIYSQIKNLRKKLKDNDAQIEIQGIYGIGYKLVYS